MTVNKKTSTSTRLARFIYQTRAKNSIYLLGYPTAKHKSFNTKARLGDDVFSFGYIL